MYYNNLLIHYLAYCKIRRFILVSNKRKENVTWCTKKIPSRYSITEILHSAHSASFQIFALEIIIKQKFKNVILRNILKRKNNGESQIYELIILEQSL